MERFAPKQCLQIMENYYQNPVWKSYSALRKFSGARNGTSESN